MSSIRGTLLATLLLAVTAVTLAAAFFVYRLARQQMDATFDYQLRQLALSIRSSPSGVEGAPEDFDFVVQIWDQSGVNLYVSRPDSGLPQAAQIGFATLPSRTGDWRVYTTDSRVIAQGSRCNVQGSGASAGVGERQRMGVHGNPSRGRPFMLATA